MGLEGVEVVIEVPDVVVSSEQGGSNQFSIGDEKRLVRLNRLFGAWKDPSDLDPIFAEIDRERHADRGRSTDSFN